ncbi:MAG: error-prone DNA polymerase [Burkholderiaceae bacterium]
MLPSYAELHCVTNFSFLRGASHPGELVERAHELGYSALAITDECSLAGVVRAHQQARLSGLKLIIGAEFSLREAFGDDSRLVLLATNRNGYGNLSELISRTRMRAAKGTYRLLPDDLARGIDDCLALLIPGPAIATDRSPLDAPAGSRASADAHAPAGMQETESDDPSPSLRLLRLARFFRERFDGRCWLGVPLLTRGHDQMLLERSLEIAKLAGLPALACGDVHYHVRSRKTLQDTLTAIRLRTPVRELGFALSPNAEQHLRSRTRLARLYPRALLDETVVVAERCCFSLKELRYEYPTEIVPAEHTSTSWLRKLTEDGLVRRYPHGAPAKIREQIEYELKLIAELEFEHYFLTVADIVAFARSRNILCQGRGSAANSVVCYCLGITEVDPGRTNLLFERFISRARGEPPDIDVDFEHQRREEVIQHLYQTYGRDRAALTATVICYRSRSALRDVGRALGVDAQRVDQVASSHQWWDGGLQGEALREAGFDPDSTLARQWLALAATLRNFPRHLSQHTGGFVLSRGPLTRLVPVENATMDDRSVIQWDKDDLDAVGLLKVDVLALGMLSAIRRALDMIGRRRGIEFRMQDIPEGDNDTYEMISRADTIGVFQIESRAQMSMLPRLRPREYYDLVVQVAIVRPGPIQGGMVHPYLKRRQSSEAVTYPKDELAPALERTLGVPIFQEQVMQIAMIAAKFTPDEADALRRSMAAWRRSGSLERFRGRLIETMVRRDYPRDFAEAIFRQIEGFGEYGFPESHAASFALLVYVSSWIKRHEPAAFLAALLNSQPMGFYAPAQLVRDARAHGVEVRGVDVLISDEDSTLEEQPGIGPYRPPDCARRLEAQPQPQSQSQSLDTRPQPIDTRPQPAVRLGLRQVRGLAPAAIERLLAAREQRRRERGPAPLFDNVEDLARSARLEPHDLQCLAHSNALRSLAGHRRQAHWTAAGVTPLPPLLADSRFDEAALELAPLSEGQEIIADYRSLGLPMGRHPLALLRERLARHGIATAQDLQTLASREPARASGLVTHRQRPGTASGTIFVTLEDETGAVNVIVWPKVFERYRRELLGARLMTVFGVWQRDEMSGEVRHLLARRIFDHSELLGRIDVRSRDFR